MMRVAWTHGGAKKGRQQRAAGFEETRVEQGFVAGGAATKGNG
jgi:hypothetical protein